MVRTVIFDFDMTLVDSIYAITRGLNKMARHFNLPAVVESDTRRVMSFPAKDFWRNLWGYHDEAWNEYFVNEVASQEKNYLELTPGALETLKKLKRQGLSLALATNRDNAWAALASMGLARYFDTAVGSADVAQGKPAPDMILMAMGQLNADPGRTLYVGDAVFDMEAANRAGIRAVGVLEGGTSRAELIRAGAWQVRENLGDLDDIWTVF
jgi:haloacid dehalogenase superfamily, subfamily IA, variant 3 with third motif having DD or ED/haloacid dehalogenase superfamily, subfamily IA, variant 1 with third motif having Dx(3-4)D or Dx(3-4)E